MNTKKIVHSKIQTYLAVGKLVAITLLAGLGFFFSASLAHASSPPPEPPCPLSSGPNRVVVDFNHQRLFNRECCEWFRERPHQYKTETEFHAITLPPGQYRVRVVSWDGYVGRESTHPQPNEQLVIEFYNDGSRIAQSNPTPDLPDNTREELFNGVVNETLTLSSAANRVRGVLPPEALGAGLQPNSLNAVCASFERIDVTEPAEASINAPPCTIAAGNSTCTSDVTWQSSGITGSVSVRQDGTQFSTTPQQTTPVLRTLNHGSNTFTFDHNGATLSSVTAQAACESGTVWNGSSCESTGSASITAPPCTIAAGNSTCTSGVTWTSSGITGSVSVRQNGTQFSTAAQQTSPVSRTLIYGSNTFTFHHNGTQLDSAVAQASCAPDTDWNGSICAADVTHDDDPDPTPIACPYTSGPDRTVVNFDPATDWLRSDRVDQQFTTPKPVNLPAGTYRVILVAWDGYPTRATSNPNRQSDERLQVQFLDSNGNEVARSSATSDIPDLVNAAWVNEEVDSALYLDRTVTSIRGFHPLFGLLEPHNPPRKPNSFLPICAVFDGDGAGDLGDGSASASINAPNCTITAGNSTCTAGVTWQSSGITGSVSVRQGVTPFSTTPQQTTPVLRTLNHGSNTFTFDHNGAPLSSVTAQAACESGTVWNGSSCESAAGPASATISAEDCPITAGNSTCNAQVTWSSSNTQPPRRVEQNEVQFSSAESDSEPRPLTQGENTFTFSDDSGELARTTATASCVLRTWWNGTECAEPDLSLELESSIIRQGQVADVRWGITNIDGTGTNFTCTIRGAGLSSSFSNITADLLVGADRTDNENPLRTPPVMNASEILLSCTEQGSGLEFTATQSIEVIPGVIEI